MRALGIHLPTLSLVLVALGAPALVAARQAQRVPAQAGSLLTPAQARILSHLSLVQLPDGNGGLVETIRISGVNLQLVNGLGATNGYPADPLSVDLALTATNGAGNLIVGYNEPGNGAGDVRTGSHNVVCGIQHSYASFGGAALGLRNTVDGAYATVTGGGANRASGDLSTVAGGINNVASGVDATVTGGFRNDAQGFVASVHGGENNTAAGNYSVVAGGTQNVASGPQAVVSGGAFNAASGAWSSVGGGSGRVASGQFDWAGGGLLEDF